ncbi:MAG: hypothetical protein GC182_17560 [Rhodopseudomonas sp.]|nr:hypothetical protein [Rhodopseudomonas sp.]
MSGCVLFPAHADWRKDAREAALNYADQKKDELVRSQSKAAIFALYKKLYAARKTINPTASRALAEVAVMTPDFEKLAEDTADAYASGDPDKIRAASESVAVKFGEQFARLSSNAETREMLGSMIGKADKVREISQALGNAMSGTKGGQRAAAEYVGQALIGLTPAAGVIGFYEASAGAMKYAKGEYVDSKIEDLYRDYKNGDAKARELILDQVRAGTGGYAYVIDVRRRDLEAQKTAAIGDAAASANDGLRERLTKTTEDEIIASIVKSFDGRIKKEKDDKARADAAVAAEKKTDIILGPLKDAIERKDGRHALDNNPYNLKTYLDRVIAGMENMPELDPNNDRHLTLASRMLSSALIYGKDSKEYADAADAVKQAREMAVAANIGGACIADAQEQALRLWKHGQSLYNAGKPAEAVPFFKNSLAICPDDKRAAQVAELVNILEEPEGFDGIYVGRGSYGIPGYEQTQFTLRLTITRDRVTGTFDAILAKAKVRQSATVTGQVSQDGHIVATLTGRSVKADAVSGRGPVDIRDTGAAVGAAMQDVMAMIYNYPFTAQLDGRITDRRAAGSLSLRRTSKPLWKAPRNGKWNISRQ